MDNNKSYLGVNSKQETFVDIDSHSQHLHHVSELYFKGLNLDYDEIDLLSECSTPVSYIPGKYLQLCDISPDTDFDVKLWPTSKRSSLTERDVSSVLAGATRQLVDDGYHYTKISRQTPQLTQTSSRLVITIAVCFIVALTALGGLATFV
uniref:Uncharacterized protein n=1 Tax=Arion vulgaris TaxID=1028688 RepID=A0A0B6ZQP9_9EUPU